MKIYRNLSCLGTLRRRTGSQQHVLEARSHRGHSPSVRMSYIHPINFALTYIISMAYPGIGYVMATICLVLFVIDWRCSALNLALIKIDGASHAEKHVLCGSGQSRKKRKWY